MVGAYERDNVGDLLFLLVTESYLPDVDIVAGAPFASPDMTVLLGHEVVAFGDVLQHEDVAAIWTVGGQVGGTSRESAFQMSRPPEEVAAYREASFDDRRALLDAAYGGAPISVPYIPTPGAFPRNAGAVTVLNSVGLSGVTALPYHVQDEVVGLLRTTDAVSVRDPLSSSRLASLGIEHRLLPDVVHAVGVVRPGEADPASDYAVVQVSTQVLDRVRASRLGRALARSTALAGLRLEIVLAGTATRHDSFADAGGLAAAIHRVDPGREVVVRTERSPWDIVDQVRGARVVISTSLHMRIIAAAYGVPRVTLRRGKTTRYAQHWDAAMPLDVRVAHLDDALATALADGQRVEVRSAADRLVRLADDNARAVAEQVRAAIAAGPGPRAALAEQRIATYRATLAAREACGRRTTALERELDASQRELEAVRGELDAAREQLERAAARTRLRDRVGDRVRARVPWAAASSLGA